MHLITNFALGGAQDYLFTIVNRLNREKFQPIVAGRMEGQWAELAQHLESVESVDIPSLRREISPWEDMLALTQIYRACKVCNVDIVHTHSSKAGVIGRLAARLASVPVIVHTVHGFPFHNFMPRWKWRIFVLTERLSARFCSALVLYSTHDYNTAERLRIKANETNELIYYGIDETPFERDRDREVIRATLGFSPADFVIGFTGRFSEQKNLDVLVDAFAEIHRDKPQAKLLLVGDGHLRPLLSRRVKDMHLDGAVVMTGYQSNVPDLLAAMDAFVMTSLWEGLSLSLVEALFAQLPVVATDVGGTADVVRDGETGWLVEPNNPDAVARALMEIMTDGNRAQARAKAGYELAVQTFNVDSMQQRIEDLYDRLLKRLKPEAGTLPTQ